MSGSTLSLDQAGEISLESERGLNVKAMPKVLGRLLRLSLRYPWRFALAMAAALGAAIFNLATPYLLGQAIDQAHHLLSDEFSDPHVVKAALLHSALLIVAACAIRGTLTGLHGYIGENIAQRVGYDLRLAFFDKLQKLNFAYHDRIHSGDLIARGMLDLEGVRAFLESGALRVLTLVLLLGVGCWRLMSVDTTLALLALSFVPFVVWRAARMGARLRVSWQRLQELMSDLTLSMEENLQGVRVVRAFASKHFELRRFDRIADAALKLSNMRITTRMTSMSIMNLTYYGAMGLVLFVGGRRIGEGLMTVGALTEFLTFMTILQQPVRQVGMIVNSSARATGAGARLFEVLDAEPDIHEIANAPDLKISEGVLRFDNVSFTYATSGDGKPALANISFEVGAGQVLGIVGPPGSGKSTLAHLIPRFYDVTEGRISIDGQDVRKVTLSSVRRTVGLVQQESFLFDASVHDNVAYPEPASNEAAVIAATQTAHVHDHIARLPGGYTTHVGERGVSLSGGQRQRLSIARGLVSSPAVMILDDSTAAIDAETEQRVRASLRSVVKKIATIVISHRLSALMDADEILVLADGGIVERGTHANLIAKGGFYADLWALQNGGINEGPLPILARTGT